MNDLRKEGTRKLNKRHKEQFVHWFERKVSNKLILTFLFLNVTTRHVFFTAPCIMKLCFTDQEAKAGRHT